jgi:hypothetical protein
VSDEFSAKSDGERAGREGAGGDGIFQKTKGDAKAILLCGEIAHQEGKTGFSMR